jgi:hypothetical protein
MNANAVRMVASAAGGLVAIYWFNLGVAGFFAAVAAGFCLYAAMLVHAVSGVKTPDAALATTSSSSGQGSGQKHSEKRVGMVPHQVVSTNTAARCDCGKNE